MDAQWIGLACGSHDTDVGHLINVLSNDSKRIINSMAFLNYVWLAPFETVVITYLLWREIGFCAFVGMLTLLFFIPLQGYFGKKISQFRFASSVLADRRIKLMNEIISGILVIKMYVWEKPFARLIDKSRRKEMRKVNYMSIIQQITSSFELFHWRIAYFLGIFCFVITGNVISAEKAFVIVGYFQDTTVFFFPFALFKISELLVSLKRFQAFLMLQYNSKEHFNIDKSNKLKYRRENKNTVACSQENAELELLKKTPDDIFESCTADYALAIRADHYTAKLDESISKYCLNDISVDIKKNSLTAIIGPVGAGKSILILAILKELIVVRGSIDVKGTISYASQKSWLFPDSIRQNILFGQPWNDERYKRVIEACALSADLEKLPFGDNTIVGERGTLLSVGQKARVNLARCIYREADIYLFDDPLSSVDIHVAKHIFEKCFRKFLKEKTCILVTHQLQYLSHMDNIVFLKQGCVIASGTYKQLQESGLNFDSFLVNKENHENNNKSLDDEPDLCKLPFPETVNNSHFPEENDIGKYVEQTEEQIIKGAVGLNIYRTYFSNGGNLCLILFIFFLLVLTQIFVSSIDVWIAYWVDFENENHLCQNNITFDSKVCSSSKNSSFYMSSEWGVYIFTILTACTMIIALLRTGFLVKLSSNASLNLHKAMFKGILYAPVNFFSTNPTGRILNRFSKDMATVDEDLPTVFVNFMQLLLPIISVICIVVALNPYILVPTLLCMIAFFAFSHFYEGTSRNIRRIECVAASSVYSHFYTSLQGLVSIRAYGAENILLNEFYRLMDVHSSASYLYIAVGRAFGTWSDLISLLYIATVAFGLILQIESISEGTVGLSITQCLFLAGTIQRCLNQKTELDNQMTAVERIKEYSDVAPENNLETCVDKKPPANWPAKGEITFENVCLRYKSKGCYILKNLNFAIRGGEKVGIVGRTGAGKSSLIAALFRLAEIDGIIKVDGIDTGTLSLQDFRKKISVIPQEPVLFSGTIRTNLDPFEEYSDSDLWHVFQELMGVFKDLTHGLNSEVLDDGSNFSVGQRQLICLARAIIRDNRILIIDEVTANIDHKTEALIQTLIRKKFKTCTVLTIAHRINTVMDSDKILVMDSGVCVEFDQPLRLLQNENGIFSKMIANTNSEMSNTLRNLAYQKQIQQDE